MFQGRLLDDIYLLDEPRTHTQESLLWPSIDPIDGTAVHEGWEHSDAHAERLTHWRQTQDYMEVVTHTLQVEVIDVLIYSTLCCCFTQIIIN